MPWDIVKLYKETGHNITDMLRKCELQGEPCLAENFTRSVDLQVGQWLTGSKLKADAIPSLI